MFWGECLMSTLTPSFLVILRKNVNFLMPWLWYKRTMVQWLNLTCWSIDFKLNFSWRIKPYRVRKLAKYQSLLFLEACCHSSIISHLGLKLIFIQLLNENLWTLFTKRYIDILLIHRFFKKHFYVLESKQEKMRWKNWYWR